MLRAFYEARADEARSKLEWWPAWVVAAKSGDLALSTGPSFFDGKPGGWFSSIWRKDADGVWRWIYDGGSAADPVSAPARTTPAVKGSISEIGEGSPAKAFEAVRTAETILSQTAQKNAAQAYRAVLATDAHLTGPRGTRTLPPTAVAERLERRPATLSLTLRGGGAVQGRRPGLDPWRSVLGSDGSKFESEAHYMHVWQRRPEGWA
ncbi:DUF4440 domain-containing protein [Caulobacter segnis]